MQNIINNLMNDIDFEEIESGKIKQLKRKIQYLYLLQQKIKKLTKIKIMSQ